MPLYQKVRHFILERIRVGRWKKNARIPSENELATNLGVSRMTVNRAVRELTVEGYLRRVQGVGTFVINDKPEFALFEISSIAEDIKRRGGILTSDVHLLAEETASSDVAAAMGVPSGSVVFHSIIVHRDRGTAIELDDRYVNPLMAPGYLDQDFQQIPPGDYLISAVAVTEVEHIIEAVLPDEQIQNLLEIDPIEPCLVMHRRTWAKDDGIATKCRLVYPGTRYRIGGRFKPTPSSRPIIP